MNKKGNFSFTLDSDRALEFLEDFAHAMKVFIRNHKWFQTQKLSPTHPKFLYFCTPLKKPLTIYVRIQRRCYYNPELG